MYIVERRLVMKKTISLLLLAVMLLSIFAGCGNNAQGDDKMSDGTVDTVYEPVSVENFNQVTEYTGKPERVVALTLNSAEILAALGEEDCLVGIAVNNNTVEDVLPEYVEAIQAVPAPEEINTGIPSLEGLMSLSPDLIVANSYYFNVPTFGTMEDYAGNGIHFYVPEGSYVENATIENTYNDIRNLGKILGKTEEAEKLVQDMQDRISAVQKAVEGQESVRVMMFDSINEDLLCVAGGSGLAQNLVEFAGGRNIFSDLEEQFPTVSMEDIIKEDPEVIVIHNYTVDPADAQSKIDYLKSAEELAGVSAVKNDRIVVIPLFAINPSLQNADAIETIAAALYPELFQ